MQKRIISVALAILLLCGLMPMPEAQASYVMNGALVSAVYFNVPAPVAGAKPFRVSGAQQTSGDDTDKYFVNNVDWFVGGEQGPYFSGEKFNADTVYTVKILAASRNNSNIFSPYLRGFINGIEGRRYQANLLALADFAITFPATGQLVRTAYNISISGQPNLSYTAGQPLNLSGLSATIMYTDGATESNIPYSSFASHNPVISVNYGHGTGLTTGHNGAALTVSVSGKTVTVGNLSVKPAERVASQITIVGNPNLSYTVGQALNLSGLSATITYTDGTTESNIPYSSFASHNPVISVNYSHGTGLTTGHNGAALTVSVSGKIVTVGNLSVKPAIANITHVTLTNVTAPVMGATPITHAVVNTNGGTYSTYALQWRVDDSTTNALTPNGKFKADTVYTAVVGVAANVGATFVVGSTATINGQTAVVSLLEPGKDRNRMAVSFTFPKTAAKTVTGFSIVQQPKLTYKQGEALDLSALKVNISYNDGSTDSNVPYSAFASNVPAIYTDLANDTLLNAATHNGKTIKITTAAGGTLYTGALAVGPTSILTANLTGITAPVLGVAPVTYTSVNTNGGNFVIQNLTWQVNGATTNILTPNATFKADTVYTAVATIKANAGASFVVGSAATINGQTAIITNVSPGVDGNSISVAFTFPKTGARAITSLTIASQPTKLSYITGQKLDLTGLAVNLIYNDGTTENTVPYNSFASHVPVITTTPAHGTTLTIATHNGKPVTVSSAIGGSANTANLEVVLNDITTVALTSIPAPVVGATPATQGVVNINGGKFAVQSMVWRLAADAPASPVLTPAGKFRASTKYAVDVVLKADATYSFTPGMKATINGQDAYVSAVTPGVERNTVVVSLAFPETAPLAVSTMTLAQQPTTLTYAAGATLNLAGLSVNITYNDGTSETNIPSTAFAAHNPVIVCSPSQGTPLTVATHHGKPITVTTNLGGLVTTNPLSVTSINIANAVLTNVAAPVLGNQPAAATDVNTNNGKFSILDLQWQVGGATTNIFTPAGKFKANTVYTAVATLKANPNYTFVVGSTVTINGLTAVVTNTAAGADGNTITATLSFTKTGALATNSFTITSQPDKLAYHVGETLDLTGLTVNLVYNDGTVESGVPHTAFATHVPKITAAPAGGTVMAIATHNGKPIIVSTTAGGSANTLNLTVVPVNISIANLTDIGIPTINTMPSSLAAINGNGGKFAIQQMVWSVGGSTSGAEFTPTGMFMPDKVYTVTITLAALAGYAFSPDCVGTVNGLNGVVTNTTPGTDGNTIQVTYTFPMTAIRKINNLVIATQPLKMNYIEGEPLDLTGLTVNITYNDGTVENRVPYANFYNHSPLLGVSVAQGATLTTAEHHLTAIRVGSPAGGQDTTGNLSVLPDVITTAVLTGITKPTIGVTPTTAAQVLINSGHFTVTNFVWNVSGSTDYIMTADGKFAPDKVYSITATLKANAGYTFAGTANATVNLQAAGATVTNVGIAANTMTVTYTFPKTGSLAVSSIQVLTDPSLMSYTQGDALALAGMSVKLTYSDNATEIVYASDFDTHTPQIRVTPSNGTLLTIADNNKQALRVTTASGGVATSITKLIVKPAKIAAVTATLPAPVKGNTPATSGVVVVGNSTYVATDVTWTVGGSQTNIFTPTGAFKAGTAYTAVITLKAVSGYTFKNGCTGKVNTQNANNVGNLTPNVAENELTLTYTFPATVGVALTNFAVITPPTTMVYTQSATLNLAGLTVSLTYNDGTTKTVPYADLALHGITPSVAHGTILSNATHNGTTLTLTCLGTTIPVGMLTVNANLIMTAAATNVTAPTIGGTPITAPSIMTAGQYTAESIVWSIGADTNAATIFANGKFKANTTYDVTITLKALNNYAFAAACTGKINGLFVSVTNTAPNTDGNVITLKYSFPPTGSRVAASITVANQPTKMAYVTGNQLKLGGLKVDITYNDGSVEHNVPYAAFATHNPTVYVSPTQNTVLSAAAHHNKPIVVTCGTASATTTSLILDFKPITDVRVTGVVAPVTSGTPALTYNSSADGVLSPVSLEWSVAGNTNAADIFTATGKFKPNTNYTAKVTVKAGTAYTFAGLCQGFINGNVAYTTNPTPNTERNTMTLSYIFPQTAPLTVASIAVDTQPTLAYFEMDALQLSGLVVRVTYSNGDTALVPFSQFSQHEPAITASPTHGYNLGILQNGNPITLHCGTAIATTGAMVITPKPVTPPTVNVTSFTLYTNPKLIYEVGQPLDYTTLAARFTMSDGSQQIIPYANFGANGITVTPAEGTLIDMSHHNTRVILSYNGYTVHTNRITVTTPPPALIDITTANITGIRQPTASFKAPAAGDLSGDGGNGHYSISDIVWSSIGGTLSSGNPFLGATSYTAEITLVADSGYTFPTSFTTSILGISTSVANSNPSTDGNTIKVSVQFPVSIYVGGVALVSGLNLTTLGPLNLKDLVITVNYSGGSPETLTYDELVALGATFSHPDGTVIDYTHGGLSFNMTLGGNTSILGNFSFT